VLLTSVPELQTHLVLSATTRDVELYEMAARFSRFHPQGLIFSKLDEASIYGAVFNVSQKTKLPIMYFTTGAAGSGGYRGCHGRSEWSAF